MPLYSPQDELRVATLPVKNSLSKKIHRSPWRIDYARLIHSASFRRLQGKTQLFPYLESDFFRNRLTHSLEVAQIAKSIAININNNIKYFQQPANQINTDITEIAGLAHDLGHPPFGHNGEKALDECMKRYGGFEGNAQTLRILAKLEKKQRNCNALSGIENGVDQRLGLNLCYRSLASILKYDKEIPKERDACVELEKGYYYTEKSLVDKIKTSILGTTENVEMKTIECQIMDIADDIAYSTYDLEDAFKAGFIKPLDMLAVDDLVAIEIAKKVSKTLNVNFNENDVKDTIYFYYSKVYEDLMSEIVNKHLKEYGSTEVDIDIPSFVTLAYTATTNLSNNGYLRTQFTSELVEYFIQAVKVKVNKQLPAISTVYLDKEIRAKVETLKHFSYIYLINSPKLKIAEYRGQDIIKEIFRVLSDENVRGYKLMPEDFQEIYLAFNSIDDKMRVICDFIAGMTDRYLLEFYGRLKSENPQTIFKPF